MGSYPKWRIKMYSNQYNPIRDFENIAREIGRAFSEHSPVAPKPEPEVESKAEFRPITDIMEDTNKIYFHIELPGVKKEDVKLAISPDEVLTITGKKSRNIAEGVNLCCRQERFFGEFKRAFKLPDNLDTEKVSAKFDAGVLLITIERKVEVKPKENIVAID